MIDADDPDLIAAEYALGTLDAGERLAAETRRAAEPAFDQAVLAWEGRLAVLTEAARESEPPASVWPGILARLQLLARMQPAAARLRPVDDRLRRQLGRWRAATAGALALAAALALWIAVGPAPRSGPGAEFVAFLDRAGDAPAYVMGADLSGERLSVTPISARTPAGKSYELWIIDPALGPPRSLGVVDEPVTRRALPSAIGADVLARATYAVTLEAAGGSATGAPSGAPAFVGHLVRAPR